MIICFELNRTKPFNYKQTIIIIFADHTILQLNILNMNIFLSAINKSFITLSYVI